MASHNLFATRICKKPFCNIKISDHWSQITMKVKVLVSQSCSTLCHPMHCSPPDFLSMEFSRQEYWSRLPFPPPGDLLDPGIEPRSPTLQITIINTILMKKLKYRKNCQKCDMWTWSKQMLLGKKKSCQYICSTPGCCKSSICKKFNICKAQKSKV